MNILLIEDNPGDVKLMHKYLKNTDYTIEVCNSVKSAKSAIKTGKYNVILSDLSLPDSDEAETIEALSYICVDTPIIVITNSVRPDILSITAKFGAFFHFAKTELPSPYLNRAIHYADLYYGSADERTARESVALLHRTKRFFKDLEDRKIRKETRKNRIVNPDQ